MAESYGQLANCYLNGLSTGSLKNNILLQICEHCQHSATTIELFNDVSQSMAVTCKTTVPDTTYIVLIEI